MKRGPKRIYQWRKKHIDLLGVISDRELAKLMKPSYTGVRNKRIKLGIKPFQPGRVKIKWTREMDNIIGTITDKEAANKLNVPKTSVFWRRKKLNIKPFVKRVEWTEEIDSLIGTASDPSISKMTNISRHTITYRRVHVLRRIAHHYKGTRHYEEPWEIVEALCRGIVWIVNGRF